MERRRTNYQALAAMTKGLAGVEPLFEHLPDGVCPMVLPVLTPYRDDVVTFLNAHGIAAFPMWKGYHRALDWSDFPEARYLKDHLLTLPVHQALTEAHMTYIAEVLSEAVTAVGRAPAGEFCP